ncbi:MAG: four helix bundle protein [Patescibacteria group bacterium]
MIVAYKLWHGYWIRFPKHTKFSLGSKIDSLFLETAEQLFIASHKTKEQKIYYLEKASERFDLLKFILQISWEIGSIDIKKYIALSEKLSEIGKMLGGWQKQTKTP